MTVAEIDPHLTIIGLKDHLDKLIPVAASYKDEETVRVIREWMKVTQRLAEVLDSGARKLEENIH